MNYKVSHTNRIICIWFISWEILKLPQPSYVFKICGTLFLFWVIKLFLLHRALLRKSRFIEYQPGQFKLVYYFTLLWVDVLGDICINRIAMFADVQNNNIHNPLYRHSSHTRATAGRQTSQIWVDRWVSGVISYGYSFM